jgi:hypothetical protein
MTIFTILLPASNPVIADAIKAAYPDDWLAINQNGTQFLVSAAGTAMQVSAKIGVADPNDRQKPAIGSAIIFATTSYYGRAPTPVWDWIKAKLETAPNG